LRIIGGSLRGRRLIDWEESGIRPVRDMVRSALFSIIADFVPAAVCLDLFAGTGALGLEALSRGARSCLFVDHADEACAIVRRNAEALGLLDAAQVHRGDVVEAVGHFVRRGHRFDLVFIDPPYGRRMVPPTLEALGDGRGLTEDPLVVVATHWEEGGDETVGSLRRVDARRYGDNRLDIYRRRIGDSVAGSGESG
jgi:16S rRNA (guanine966-N2)-methyltransferase